MSTDHDEPKTSADGGSVNPNAGVAPGEPADGTPSGRGRGGRSILPSLRPARSAEHVPSSARTRSTSRSPHRPAFDEASAAAADAEDMNVDSAVADRAKVGDAIRLLVEAEVKDFPEAVKSHIRKVTTRLSNTIDSLQRTNEFLGKFQVK